MRKLFWQFSVTLNGFMEGPNGELDHTAQGEISKCKRREFAI